MDRETKAARGLLAAAASAWAVSRLGRRLREPEAESWQSPDPDVDPAPSEAWIYNDEALWRPQPGSDATAGASGNDTLLLSDAPAETPLSEVPAETPALDDPREQTLFDDSELVASPEPASGDDEWDDFWSERPVLPGPRRWDGAKVLAWRPSPWLARGAGLALLALVTATVVAVATRPGAEPVAERPRPAVTARPQLIEVALPSAQPEPRPTAPPAPATPQPTSAPAIGALSVEMTPSCSGGTLRVNYALSSSAVLDYYTLYVDKSVARGGPVSRNEITGTYERAGSGTHELELVGRDRSGARKVAHAQVVCR